MNDTGYGGAAARTVDPAEYRRITDRVSAIGVAANLLLSVFKLAAGVIARSGAMISDAVHSASDVFGSLIVIIGARLSTKDPDGDHPYGHERLEPVIAIILSVILLITGLFIGYSAVRTLRRPDEDIAVPGVLALIAACISIAVKEGLFRYTKTFARRLNSSSLMASAWHHRSDALSSVGAVAGIAASRMGHPMWDPLASSVICIFIAKAAYDIFMDAVGRLVDRAADEETSSAIRAAVLGEEGVLAVDRLDTRVFGNRIYVDVEIGADGDQSLRSAHSIAERVHDVIEEDFPLVKHVMVHVNPVQND